MRTVETAVAALAEGQGGCLVLEGAEGLGKTTLLAYATNLAAERGILAARGAATQLDHLAPLSTLKTTFDQCTSTRCTLEQLGEATTTTTLIERLGDWFEQRALQEPLLVGIDDIHHADELTTLALRMLVPALAHMPVLWVLSRRPPIEHGPGQDVLEMLLRYHARRMTLPALSGSDIEELCTQLTESRPGPGLLAYAAQAGGDPLLLAELVRTLDREGRISRTDGVAELLDCCADEDEGATKAMLPADFVDSITLRIRAQSDGVRALLRAGAVLGPSFTLREAASLVEKPMVDLVQGVTEAVGLGYLAEEENGLAFRRELTRAVVYRSLTPAIRQVLHCRAAEIAETEQRNATEVAEHLIRGGDTRRAADMLREALAGPGARVPTTEAGLVGLLVTLNDDLDETSGELITDTMRVLVANGHIEQARWLGERATPKVSETSASGAVVQAFTMTLRRTEDVEAAIVEHTRRVLARPDVPRSTRADLLAEQAYALIHSSSASDAEQPGREAVELGECVNRPSAVALGSVARSVAARSRGELTKAHNAAQEAVHTADLAGSEAVARHPRLWLAPTLTALDRFDEAEATLTLCTRQTSALGATPTQRLLRLHRAELQLSSGLLHEAAAEAEAGLEMAGDNPDPDTARLLAILGEVEIRQGRLDSAREYIDRAFRLEGRAGDHRGHIVWRWALLQQAEGRPDAAAQTVTTFYSIRPHLTEILASDPAAANTFVRLALHGGAVEEARYTADVIQDISHRNPEVISLAAAAAQARGVVSNERSALHFAVDLFRYSPRPLARAAAVEDAGLAEMDFGERDRGRELLAESASIWSGCHATLDAKRARELLDVHEGEAPRSPDPGAGGSDTSGSPAGGSVPDVALSDLTPAERRVVRLVAQGMTNRQIASALVVSPHTVDSHLRHSFSKLNVTSRVELTRLFLTQDHDRYPVKA